MKTFTLMGLLLLISVFLSLPAVAQEPVRFGAAGVGYFAAATPNIQGWAALGVPITIDNKTISYTSMDVGVVSEPNGQSTVAGLHLQYSLHPGLAYRLFNRGTWSLYGLAAPGFVANGESIKGSFEYGGFLHKQVSKYFGVMLAFTKQQNGTEKDFAPRGAITVKF